jgi:hypothetical protein
VIYWEIIAISFVSGRRAKDINAICWRKAEVLNLKSGGAWCTYLASEFKKGAEFEGKLSLLLHRAF